MDKETSTAKPIDQQRLPPGERLAAGWAMTRQAYIDAGIGIDYWVSDRRIRRLTREQWLASEDAEWPGQTRL